MQRINLTLADGQVAASATQITTGAGDVARRLNVIFYNTADTEQTVLLYMVRNGGTARQIGRAVLAPDERWEVDGLPLNITDSLRASTSTAEVVDYVISIAADDALLRMTVYDADGIAKTAPAILEQMATIFG